MPEDRSLTPEKSPRDDPTSSEDDECEEPTIGRMLEADGAPQPDEGTRWGIDRGEVLDVDTIRSAGRRLVALVRRVTSMRWKAPELEKEMRHVPINGDLAVTKDFCTNYISTTKYSFVSFLPMCFLFNIFRLANFYFLIIGILSYFPEVSPFDQSSRYSTLSTLAVVVSVSMIKEAVEDFERYKSDREMNGKETDVLRGTQFERTPWRDVRVGDVIRVRADEQLPADIVLLSSSGKDSSCFVETANLDGETNLKIKKALADTAPAGDQPAALARIKGEVECEPPCAALYTFTGRLSAIGCPLSPDANCVCPIDLANVLWRGSCVRNTDWAIGVVIYSGHDTRVLRNSQEKKRKISNLELLMNRQLWVVFSVLIFLASGSAIGNYVWLRLNEGAWYMEYPSNPSASSALRFLTFIVLYSYIVPISLYVSVEIVKAAQAMFVNWDIGLYDPETDTPARARTFNINEELGQIQYVFSDKTGTLTRNEMRFVKCSVGGILYGADEKDHDWLAGGGAGAPHGRRGQSATAAAPASLSPRTQRLWAAGDGPAPRADGVSTRSRSEPLPGAADSTAPAVSARSSLTRRRLGSDSPVYDIGGGIILPKSGAGEAEGTPGERASTRSGAGARASLRGEAIEGPGARALGEVTEDIRGGRGCLQADRVRDLLAMMAVCHTALIAPDPKHAGRIRYDAASPDEGALVEAARAAGFVFASRGEGTAVVDAAGVTLTYEILHILEFSSDRKRMSIICRDPSGRLMLFCKGADSVIFERAAPGDPMIEPTTTHLECFGSQGLRTLVFAKAELDEGRFMQWESRYAEASLALADRRAKMDALAAEIEVNLQVVGATAIEDRLQEKVPETLRALQEASIKVWVLTGDKQETAVSIGFSCGILHEEQELILLNETTPEGAVEAVRTLARQHCGEKAAKRQSLRERFWTDREREGREPGAGAGRGFGGVDLSGREEVLAAALAQAAGQEPPGRAGAKANGNGNGNGAAAAAAAGSGPAAPSGVHHTRKPAIIVDGATLGFVLESDEARPAFLRLARRSATVICCRVSPLQKAQVVRLVRRAERAITLAIGDGANDVGMIQAAHVGVGISGKEGMQAVLASDFAIAQFRFLRRLLFVHGRWSYKRTVKLILYSFYKNNIICWLFFWWTIRNGWSGQTLFDGWTQGLYNVVFTSVPILVLATQDQENPAHVLENNPRIYTLGLKNTGFNFRIFWGWFLDSVFHSLVVFFLPFEMLAGSLSDGTQNGFWAMSTAVCTVLVIVVTLRLAVAVSSWNWLLIFFVVASNVVYFLFLLAYCAPGLVAVAPDMSGIAFKLFANPAFWLCIAVVPAVALIPDLVWEYVKRNWIGGEKERLQVEHRRLKKLQRRRPPRAASGSRRRQILMTSPSHASVSFRGFAFSAAEYGASRFISTRESQSPNFSRAGSFAPALRLTPAPSNSADAPRHIHFEADPRRSPHLPREPPAGPSFFGAAGPPVPAPASPPPPSRTASDAVPRRPEEGGTSSGDLTSQSDRQPGTPPAAVPAGPVPGVQSVHRRNLSGGRRADVYIRMEDG
eukprot:tig00000204_g17756.t1